MTGKQSRREFVKSAAGALSGLGLLPILGTGPTLEREAHGSGRGPAADASGSGRSLPLEPDGLPPRTVGLRSLGGDFVFDPAGLRLEPGAELTWLNMGDFHTATAFHPDYSGLLPGEVPLRIPEGAEPWHSGMLGLSGGTEFSHRFEVPGVYDYFCQPHYNFGMVGRVVVPPPEGPAPKARPARELNEASRSEMPAVDTILGAAGRALEWSSRINGVLLLRARGEPAAASAQRVVEAMTGDAELGRLLEAAGLTGRALSEIERFAEAVSAEAGYESLVSRADAAKAPLGKAVAARK